MYNLFIQCIALILFFFKENVLKYIVSNLDLQLGLSSYRKLIQKSLFYLDQSYLFIATPTNNPRCRVEALTEVQCM